MAANVESMFYTRVAPWHGIGFGVESALSSDDALEQSGLDWNVIQRPIMTDNYEPISSSHDGSGAIKVCMTPIRVVCQNTLNLAINSAKPGMDYNSRRQSWK